MLLNIQHIKTDTLKYDQRIDRNQAFPEKPDFLMAFEFENVSWRQRFRSVNRKQFEKIKKGDSNLILLPNSAVPYSQTGAWEQEKIPFCFQLSESQASGLIIIISPLCVLMRNPEISLKVNMMHSDADDEAAETNIFCSDIRFNKTRILYINPESLKIKTFQQGLETIIGSTPIHLLIIDHIHCISEWGPEFRPSYLKIPALVEDFKNKNPHLTLLCLTTFLNKASKQDIINLLQIKEKTPVWEQNPTHHSPFTLHHSSFIEGLPNFLIIPKPDKEENSTSAQSPDKPMEFPNIQCEKDMRQRVTFVPKCLETSCELGRESHCHYGQHHLFISKYYPDVETQTVQALRILDKLISRKSDSSEKSDLCNIQVSSENERNTELALYRLSIIGIITEFFVRYNSGKAIFDISGFTGTVDETYALNSLLDYLKKHDQAKKYSCTDDLIGEGGFIPQVREKYSFNIWKRIIDDADNGRIRHYHANPVLFDNISDYLTAIISCVHDDVITMQYRAIWNIKESVRDDANLKPEQEASLVSKLRFKKLFQWIENEHVPFDVDVAAKYVSVQEKDLEGFGNLQGLTHDEAIYRHICRILEHSPRNIKALYLACKFSPEHEKERNILELLRIANKDVQMPVIIKFYEMLKTNDTEMNLLKFDILDDEYGALNIRQGERWLYEKAKKLPADPLRTDLLCARLVLNGLKETDFSVHKSRLEQLILAVGS